MSQLQIRQFGPYFSLFLTNSYGYSSQMSQNLPSNFRIFALARIARQAPSLIAIFAKTHRLRQTRLSRHQSELTDLVSL